MTELTKQVIALTKQWFARGYDSADINEMDALVCSELAALREENQRLTKAMRALESFTPSGSEFVNDVTRCSQFIRERISRSHEIAIQAVIGRKSAESSLARAQAENAKLREELTMIKERWTEIEWCGVGNDMTGKADRYQLDEIDNALARAAALLKEGE